MTKLVASALLGLSLCLFVATGTSSPAAAQTKRGAHIEFAVTPPSVIIFLDGRRLGKASDVSLVKAKPGRRVVRLERGEDATEMEIDLPRGKKLHFKYAFE